MKRFHKPLPTHNRIHFDPHQIIALVGPWGSGKSTIDAMELAVHCHKFKCDALVVRDTYPALKDSCCAKWIELFNGQGEMNWGPPPTWHWTNEMRGLKVLFRSAEDPTDIQKFGSVEVGAAWMEEVTPGLLPGGALNIGMAPEVLGGVFGRIRKWNDHPLTPSCATPPQRCDHRKLYISALPPPSTKHWFHQLFYDKRPLNSGLTSEQSSLFTERSILYKLTPEENSKNLPEDYYTLQAAFLTSEDQIARFLRGEVGSGYGRAAIYGEQWNDILHVNEKIKPSDGPMILGIDGGLDAACVWLQIQPSGRLFVLGELPTHGLGLEDFAYAALQYGGQQFSSRHYQAWADPAIFARGQDGRSASLHLQAGGITARPGPQDVKIRVGAVRTWLSRFGALGPLLQIHPRCEMLIEGFRGSYHWKIAAGIPVVGKAEKNEFCMTPDTLVLTADLRWVLAEQVQEGDTLYGFSEHLVENGKMRRWRKIKKAVVLQAASLHAPTRTFHTTEGDVTVSQEHRMLAAPARRNNLRWVPAKDIQLGWRIAFLCKPWTAEDTYDAGWLAGMFDGEGCLCLSDKATGYSSRLEIGQNEGPTLRRVRELLAQRGLTFAESRQHKGTGVKLRTTRQSDIMRTLGILRPPRLLAQFDQKVFERWSMPNGSVTVEHITDHNTQEVIALHTSTGTLFTNGFASHNSHPHDALQYPLAGMLRRQQGDEQQKQAPLNPDQLGRFSPRQVGLSRFTRRPPGV